MTPQHPIVILDIPKPSGVDWISSNSRLHLHRKAKLTKEWRAAGYTAVCVAFGAQPKPFERPVHVTATFWKPTKAHYDPNNLWPTVKAICDGITDAGLWVDDDHQHVIGPDMRHGGYGPERVIIRIEEVK